MEFRICFIYSVSYLLAFSIIPTCKANYDAQLAMKMKDMDMARMVGNKPRPKMLHLKSDNELNHPLQDNKIKRQSSNEIHPSSEDYEETPRNKQAKYTLATRKIFPTAAFDDYTPRYRPITARASRTTGHWSKPSPLGNIKYSKEDEPPYDPRIHDRTLIYDETSPMEYIPGIEKFSKEDDNIVYESNEIDLNQNKASNVPTTSLRWSTKPRKIPTPIRWPKKPRKIPTPIRWPKKPRKIPTPIRWSTKPHKIPTPSRPPPKPVSPPIYKQPQPYYTTKRLWTSPLIMTFNPTAKPYPHFIPKNADIKPPQDIEDAEPDDDAWPDPNQEDAEPDDDEWPVLNDEDAESDDNTWSVPNEENAEPDDDAGSVPNEDDSDAAPGEDDELLDYNEEDPDVSVESDESEPSAVSRVTRCTTSKPLPKLDPNYLPTSSEENEIRSSAEGNAENEPELKKYRAPNVVELPHNYIDDE